MIIPIKCFTCGNVLADKYKYYQITVRQRKVQENGGNNIKKVVYLTNDNAKKTHEGVVLDELKITNMCCRRHMLTHVDIE
jgi:DNA-directed RNA polymerase I, II, and III subunit RPABC5